MFLIKTIILTSSVIFLLSKNSMIMIFSLVIVVISGTFLMMKTMKMIWLSYMVLMLTAGGMMILYVFIISLNSNEKMSFGMKKGMIFLLPIPLMFLIKNKPQNFMINSNFLVNLNMNLSIFLSMTAILITMMMLSKISLNPFTPSKSIK